MKYLIYRNDGIGDLIISTPFIQSLKKLDDNAEISLVCSKRNIHYAKLLQKNNLIDNVLLSIDKGKTFLDFVKMCLYNLRIKPDVTIVLKSSNTNFLSALLLKAKTVIGTVYINENKITPHKLLNYFLDKNETIDCRNNFANSSDILMKDHYKSLFLKTFNLKKNNYIDNYFKPTMSLSKSLQGIDISKISSGKNILLHLDEKWKRYDSSQNKIIEIIDNLKKKMFDYLIITMGNNYEEHNLYLFNKYGVDINSNLAEIKDKLIFFKKPDIHELISLIILSDSIITTEGGVTHICASFEKNIINLIDKNNINFLKKWKPNVPNCNELIINEKALASNINRNLFI